MTPANTNERDKSPWRLRFEKFLNHEEPTPISPMIDTSNSNKPKVKFMFFFLHCHQRRFHLDFLAE